MAVEGDIAQLTAQGTYLGQQCLNVYFYRLMDAPTAGWAEGLAAEFIAEVLLPIRAIQVSDFVWNNIQVINLFDPLDLHEEPLALAGNASSPGEALPPFMAWSFKLQRGNTLVRNGRKSIGGMGESMQVNGVITGSFVTPTNAVAAALSEELNPGVGVDLFDPVIVKRVPYTTVDGDPAFRLPESAAEMGANWAYVTSASYRQISTMNSRKFGHGI